jgi:hypothetical protein
MAAKNSKFTKPMSSKTSWKPSPSQDMQEKIRQKAYELFEKRGYGHGNDLADWLEAEKMVKSGKR